MGKYNRHRNGDINDSIYTNHKDNKIPIQLDIDTLTAMCKFIISDSIYIKLYDLYQLREFIYMIDTNNIIDQNNDIDNRLKFIRYGLEARLDHKLIDKRLVFRYINNKFSNDIDFIQVDSELSKEDIQWVNESISEVMKYGFIYKEIDAIRDLCNRFYNTGIGHRGDIIPEFEREIDKIKNGFRRYKIEDENDSMFTLDGERFISQIEDTYKKEISTSRRLRCGMQGVNQLTGLFQSGRVYMLFGTTGVGKSITLLNIAYQMKLYNRDYICKDPTRRPCIILLTMENSIEETIVRLFDLINSSNIPMSHYSNVEEIINIFRNKGSLDITDNNPIDIIIKYKPNRSISTDYLYNLYDELWDSGYEPICLIQDHVKRIRSIENEKDLRIELGNIINELKVFAIEKDIPVLSNSHLNREAMRIIDNNNTAMNIKADITRMVGRSTIGESTLMLDNLDMGIIINKEWDRDGNAYMIFSVIKKRVKNIRDYVAQPFVQGSEIRLVEDINQSIPQFKDTLKNINNISQSNEDNIKVSSYSNLIGMINDTNQDDISLDNNEIANMSYYTANNINQYTKPLSSDIPKYNNYMHNDTYNNEYNNSNIDNNIHKEKISPLVFIDRHNIIDGNDIVSDMRDIFNK